MRCAWDVLCEKADTARRLNRCQFHYEIDRVSIVCYLCARFETCPLESHDLANGTDMARTIYETPILNTTLQWLADKGLHMFGWRMEGSKPDLDKFVLIAAPHTSNWDVLVMLAAAFTFRAELFWIGKDSLFRGPFKALLRWMGGIPINRSGSQNLVAKTAALFDQHEKLILAVAPEGTRKKTRYWKTGFYYIAHTAGVPIVMGFIDFQRKVAGLGPTFIPTGDIEADMQKLQAFYANIAGKNQEQASLATVAPK